MAIITSYSGTGDSDGDGEGRKGKREEETEWGMSKLRRTEGLDVGGTLIDFKGDTGLVKEQAHGKTSQSSSGDKDLRSPFAMALLC